MSRFLTSLKSCPRFFYSIDPGEVAVCFGDEGTWCPLYKHDSDGQVHQEYSDGEETTSSLSSDDDLLSLTQNVKTLNVNDVQSKQTVDSNDSRSLSSSSTSRTSSPLSNTISTNTQSMNDCDYSGIPFFCNFLIIFNFFSSVNRIKSLFLSIANK